MARETKKEKEEKPKKATKSNVPASSKKVSSKKEAHKIDVKKESNNKKAKVASKVKEITKKGSSKSAVSEIVKEEKNKKTKATSSKKSSSKKASTSKATKKTSSKPKSTEKKMLAEYYDLPYGYNETTVKILAQTPTTLFVYWDISEEDRNSLVAKYGENFFYESKPILIVHNNTKNYSFEIEINDFANSWYIRCQEPNCDYTIELGRKLVERPEEYIYIDSSNEIISPNDHILFETSNLGHVRIKNIKTGVISEKDYGSLRFINNIDKLYGNIYDVYTALYNEDTLNELTNPSSGEFILR